MSKDLISTIIKGKKVTGDDIGRLLLADMAEEYKTFLTTGQVKSIISQDEFNRLLNSLPNNFQIERYNHYVSIHNTIKTYLAVTRGTAQEVKARIRELKRILEGIRGAYQSKLAKESMPLILSQKQYDELMKQCEPDREEKYKYIDIFINSAYLLFGTYKELKDMEDEIKTRPEVEAIIRKYEKEPVKNPDLRRAYRSTYDTEGEDGYFRFRPTTMSIGKNREEFLYNCALQNIKPIEERVNTYHPKDLKKPVDEVFIKDVLTPEQISEHIEHELYDTPPETVYKSDIMTGDFIRELYKLYDLTKTEEKEVINLFKLYCREVPELVEYVKAYLNKFKCMKPYKDIADKDLLKPLITMEELLRDDVADYNSWALYAFRDEYPRAYNGVAILQDKLYNIYDKEYLIDEQEDFIEAQESWENILDDVYINAINEIEKEGGYNTTQDLYASLKQVYAYNEFVKIIADVTKLPVVAEAFSYGIAGIEEDIKDYNRLLYILLVMAIPSHAKSKYYDDDMKFRDTVFKTFPYIDSTKAEVTPEDREKAVEYISDINNFKGISAVSKPFYILNGCGD